MPNNKRKTIFITGTDTGVGKTLLTAMLLRHMRQSGVHALAMKPYCSGDRHDPELLRRAMDKELTCEEINPYFFAKPLAPLAAVNAQKLPSRSNVLAKIRAMERRCEVLLVEGAGGLMVPLGRRFFVVDLIQDLSCDTILVAPNKLGSINHTLLSLKMLESRCANRNIKTVLVQQKRPDLASKTNHSVLGRQLGISNIYSLTYLGVHTERESNWDKNLKRIKKTLARLA